MKAWEVLGESSAPDGTDIQLRRRDDEYLILANGKPLMSSRLHGSEEALATLGCSRAQAMEQPRVLVGGLGMGFTLRAVLDVLPFDAVVTVAELVPAVIEWNRASLAALAGHPLRDPRVRLQAGDVGFTLRANPGRFDVVLLDVDNGPAAFTAADNAGLYDNARCCRRLCRTPSRRNAGRLVCMGRPEVRTASSLLRISRGSGERARPPA